jgi:hypothetical protein
MHGKCSFDDPLTRPASFDHLIGALQECLWDDEAKSLGGF